MRERFMTVRFGLPAALVAAAAAWSLLAWLFKAHCLFDGGWSGSEQYWAGCYSDMVPFWAGKGLNLGRIPYLESAIEYPVLTGALIGVEGAIARLFGGALAFVTVGTIVNAGLLLVSLALLRRIGVPDRRLWWLALAPPALLYLGHNWDMLAVALTLWAVGLHREGKPWRAGAAVGLGAAAKLFPVLLLPLLLFDRLDRRDGSGFAATLVAAVAAWALVNVPVALLAPENWALFYTFSSERSGTYAATWSLLEQAEILRSSVPERNLWSFILFAGGAVAITLFGRRGYPDEAWKLMTPVLAWFVVTGKVYSPQFDLWLVPIAIATLPRLWPLAALFAANALVYWMEFWFFMRLEGGSPSASQDALALAGWLRVEVLLAIIAVSLWPALAKPRQADRVRASV